MRRFTIIGLMALVLGMAVAIAALRNADDYWAGGFILATALLIGVAALGAPIIPAPGVQHGLASRFLPAGISPWRSLDFRTRTWRSCQPPGC